MEPRNGTCRASRASEAEARAALGAYITAPEQIPTEVGEPTETPGQNPLDAAIEVRGVGNGR